MNGLVKFNFYVGGNFLFIVFVISNLNFMDLKYNYWVIYFDKRYR